MGRGNGEEVDISVSESGDASEHDGAGPLTIDRQVLLDVLEPLRLAHIYALKDSQFADELGEDFKPWKWQGHEKDYALQASSAYIALLRAMEAADEASSE